MKRTWKRGVFLTACFLASLAAAHAAPKMPTFFARRDYPGLLTYFLQVAETNGDGKLDLVVQGGNGIVVCAGNGDGTFQSAVSDLVNDSGINFLVLGDFNGDGILDVAAPGNQGVWLFTGKGDGTF